MFVSRGDRDLGVAFLMHPGSQSLSRASIHISEERHLDASRLLSIGRCWENDRPGEDIEALCLP